MNISPLDIRKHEFRKVIRGYDVDEVMTFLEMLFIKNFNFININALLNEKVANFDNQLKKYRDIESTLRETLLSAQKAREDTITTAKKQSEVIIREAEVKAASIVEEGRTLVSRLRSSFTELKIQKDNYFTKIKTLTKVQLETLEQFSFPEEEKFESIDSILKEDKPPEPQLEESIPQNQGSDAPLSRDTFFPDEDDKK